MLHNQYTIETRPLLYCDNAFQSPFFIIAPVWHSITFFYIDCNNSIMAVIEAVQLEVYSLRVPFCPRSLLSVLTKELALYKTNLFQGKNELNKNQNFELLGNKETKLEEKKNTNLDIRYNPKFMKVRYVIQLRFGCTMLHIIV